MGTFREMYGWKYLNQYKGDYPKLALLYAEHYGIVEYRVQGNIMIYNVSYPATRTEKHHTYQFKVNLDTYQSSQGTLLKRYDKKGELNRR